MLPLFLIFAFATSLPAVDLEAGGPPCWIQDAVSVEKNVWMMCDRGSVLASGDFGKTWRQYPVTTQARLRAVAFLDARRGFIAGDDATLLRTEDGGQTWSAVEVPVKNDYREIYFHGESGWLTGYGGTMLHTSDGGKTWAPQRTGTSQSIESIYFVDHDHGWAVGWAGTILRTTDGGTTWEEIRTPAAEWSLSGVYFRDAREGWAVGMLGQILHSSDGGATWTAIESGVKSWLRSVTVDADGRGWITAENDLLATEDGGKTWKAVGKEGWVFLERFVRVNGELWAVGPFGIYTKGAGPQDWTAREKFGDVRGTS
ncbi:MAG: YCF48-related protein [Bryobacteraceae bacterium]